MRGATGVVLVGIGLMVAPALLDYGDPANATHRVSGPVLVSLATTAIWQATRGLLWATLPVGIWLLGEPILLRYGGAAAGVSLGAGAMVVLLSRLRGSADHRLGGGWRALLRSARDETPVQGRR